jgi:hypothetical protein
MFSEWGDGTKGIAIRVYDLVAVIGRGPDTESFVIEPPSLLAPSPQILGISAIWVKQCTSMPVATTPRTAHQAVKKSKNHAIIQLHRDVTYCIVRLTCGARFPTLPLQSKLGRHLAMVHPRECRSLALFLCCL